MMYYKIIKGKRFFSECAEIELNGQIIESPDTQQIAAAGWLPYSPEPVPHTPSNEPTTKELLQAIKSMLSAKVTNLTDEDALDLAAIFPTWASMIGKQVNIGERYWYDEKLYKVVQTHVVQCGWTPDTAASLFVEVSIEEWPEWRQPTGAQDAYNTGDKVTFQGHHYVSLIDGNVYSPADYPAGWEARP